VHFPLLEVRCFRRDQQTDDETEKPKHRTEDFDNQNFYEPKDKLTMRDGDIDAASTYKLGSAASASAAPLPLIPTDTPHTKLHIPTVNPDQNRAYPAK
jgi:hypothetical protein